VIAGAQGELRALAELLEAPVATTISGKGAIAEDHPLALGVVGSNGGTPETRALVDEADMILFVGCRAGSVTTERWRHPAPGKVRVAHIDIDPAVIGVNYPTEVALVGDARLALAALREEVASHLDSPRDRPTGSARVARAKAEKFAGFEKLARSDAAPICPERIVATLKELLPRDALVVADAGTPCPYFSAYYECRSAGRHFITNRAHGALGYALPAAIGAQIGRPAARCVAIMGDGSFGFASGELETIVRLGLPIAMVVIANATFGWIKAGQKSGFAERYFAVDFTPGQHARIAEAYGIRAWRVEHPAKLRPALAAALELGGPSLVDVVTQPLHEARAPVSEWVA
jgi:acetolactate synthase-1/2/3 large subunit